MVYSICWSPNYAGPLTKDDVKKSDTLSAGMLEQVLPDLICWHGVKHKDVDRVLTYIGLEFGPLFVSVEEERRGGSVCVPVCGVRLGDPNMAAVGEKSFTVWQESGGGTKRPFLYGLTEQGAYMFCYQNNFEWLDENGFVWELFIEEE